MKKAGFVVLGLLIGLMACNVTSENSQDGFKEVSVLPDDFVDFLVEFHSDSLFQIEHIRFPLQGMPAMMDSTYQEGDYHWSKENWVQHNTFDPDNEEFEQVFTVFDQNMIIEKILHINRSMGMERRFAKSEDGWYLIYYVGMNFIKQE